MIEPQPGFTKINENSILSDNQNEGCTNDTTSEIITEAPAEVHSNPALLFLYYRIEQILGIKAGTDALKNLNKYLEEKCGASFIKNPAAYEYLLTSREQIYDISKILTVNETYFFREGVHFDLLVNLLPEFAKLNRPIQICCAAVSIGCEAYSIAMLLDYHIKKGLNLDFAVDAFDVCAQSIETAKNARYTENALRNDGSSWKHVLDLYLIPDNGEYLVTQNIRRKVRFFPHNIMRGLERNYDIIFFRNSLIYFSTRNRLAVINNLAESLFSNGLLFLGISETASIKHPLLANRYTSDVFYFQKTSVPEVPSIGLITKTNTNPLTETKVANISSRKAPLHNYSKPVKAKKEFIINYSEVADILKVEEGKPNAENIINILKKEETSSNETELSDNTITFLSNFKGSQLIACVIFCLHTENYEFADKIISFLEENNIGAPAKFLRGEYYFLRGITEDAEKYYQEASAKDKYFWPAFYRIASLAAEGNKTRYEYKIKKTIESIELLQNLESNSDLNYEYYLGGFSTDYFLRILEKKLS